MPRHATKPAAPDVTEQLKRHVELTGTLRGLIAQCEALRDGGKVAEARRLFRQAEVIHAELRELEGRS